MKLYLVRHGEAVPKEVDGSQPLSDQGTERIKSLASHLSRSGIRVDRILHSDKKRAKQTACLIAEQIEVGEGISQQTGLAPLDPVGRLAQQIEDWADDVMLVGHLPFLARLSAHLLAGDEDKFALEFGPGTTLCLARDGLGAWSASNMIRPDAC